MAPMGIYVGQDPNLVVTGKVVFLKNIPKPPRSTCSPSTWDWGTRDYTGMIAVEWYDIYWNSFFGCQAACEGNPWCLKDIVAKGFAGLVIAINGAPGIYSGHYFNADGPTWIPGWENLAINYVSWLHPVAQQLARAQNGLRNSSEFNLWRRGQMAAPADNDVTLTLVRDWDVTLWSFLSPQHMFWFTLCFILNFVAIALTWTLIPYKIYKYGAKKFALSSPGYLPLMITNTVASIYYCQVVLANSTYGYFGRNINVTLMNFTDRGLKAGGWTVMGFPLIAAEWAIAVLTTSMSGTKRKIIKVAFLAVATFAGLPVILWVIYWSGDSLSSLPETIAYIWISMGAVFTITGLAVLVKLFVVSKSSGSTAIAKSMKIIMRVSILLGPIMIALGILQYIGVLSIMSPSNPRAYNPYPTVQSWVDWNMDVVGVGTSFARLAVVYTIYMACSSSSSSSTSSSSSSEGGVVGPTSSQRSSSEG